MYNLNKCRPIICDDLMRVGHDYDGGYVLSKRQIEGCDALLSFGIGDDWSFEEQFLDIKNVPYYGFDYSVSAEKTQKKRLIYFAKSLKHVFLLNFKVARDFFMIAFFPGRFNAFFNPQKNRNFVKKHLGSKKDENEDSEKYVCFDTVFSMAQLSTPIFAAFVKLDIECYEYRVFHEIIPYSEKISGIAAEFHWLNDRQSGRGFDKKFDGIIEALSEHFFVAHIHACNYGVIDEETKSPNTLEITFINKKLVKEPVTFSGKSYPLAGLDKPCNPRKKDFALDFDFNSRYHTPTNPGF